MRLVIISSCLVIFGHHELNQFPLIINAEGKSNKANLQLQKPGSSCVSGQETEVEQEKSPSKRIIYLAELDRRMVFVRLQPDTKSMVFEEAVRIDQILRYE